MNKQSAKQTLSNLTVRDIEDMFENAKSEITCWTVPSIVNPQFSKGAVWNILYPSVGAVTEGAIVCKSAAVVNMVREFGHFLPEEKKLSAYKKREPMPEGTHHEKPIF